MRSPERPAAGSSRVGLSQILVVAQIAFALVLVVAAGLFGRTLSNLHAIETGIQPGGRAAVQDQRPEQSVTRARR